MEQVACFVQVEVTAHAQSGPVSCSSWFVNAAFVLRLNLCLFCLPAPPNGELVSRSSVDLGDDQTGWTFFLIWFCLPGRGLGVDFSHRL